MKVLAIILSIFFGSALHAEVLICEESLEVPNNQWVMIGFPCDTENRTVADIFPSSVFGVNGVKSGLYYYDNVNNAYVSMGDDDVVTVDRGYMFTQLTGSTKTLTIEGIDNPNSMTQPLASDYNQPKWSIVANTRRYSIKPSQMKVIWVTPNGKDYTDNVGPFGSQDSHDIGYTLDNGAYVAHDLTADSPVIDKWAGIWVVNKTEVTSYPTDRMFISN